MREKPFSLTWLLVSVSIAVMAGGFWISLAEPTGMRWKASTAPGWWAFIYLVIGVAILPFSAWAGYAIAKRECRREQTLYENSRLDEASPEQGRSPAREP
jgi:hypothetical protein